MVAGTGVVCVSVTDGTLLADMEITLERVLRLERDVFSW